MRNIARCVVLGLVSAALTAQAQTDDGFDESTIRVSDLPANPPQFEAFQVKEKFDGSVAKPDVRSHPRSRMFRTVIREGAKDGPNFAGHYTILGWGCGAGCVSLAIVDAKTGRVFHPENLQTVDNFNVDYDAFEPPDGRLVKYRLDSRLLVVIGGINEDPARRGISYFVWEGEKLRRIRFAPKPLSDGK
jgi:hypothetical protein